MIRDTLVVTVHVRYDKTTSQCTFHVSELGQAGYQGDDYTIHSQSEQAAFSKDLGFYLLERIGIKK